MKVKELVGILRPYQKLTIRKKGHHPFRCTAAEFQNINYYPLTDDDEIDFIQSSWDDHIRIFIKSKDLDWDKTVTELKADCTSK